MSGWLHRGVYVMRIPFRKFINIINSFSKFTDFFPAVLLLLSFINFLALCVCMYIHMYIYLAVLLFFPSFLEICVSCWNLLSLIFSIFSFLFNKARVFSLQNPKRTEFPVERKTTDVYFVSKSSTHSKVVFHGRHVGDKQKAFVWKPPLTEMSNFQPKVK